MLLSPRILHNSTNYLADRVQSSYTHIHRRTLLVAAAIFSCFAALYFFVKAYYWNVTKQAVPSLIQPLPEEAHPKNHQNRSNELPQTVHPKLEIDATTTLIFHQHTQKYVYISPAPPIKNLVISGGGAKGVVLPGVLKAFEEHSVGDITFKEQLDHVAGTSIGAVTAAFMAVGIPVNDLIEATTKEDFKALLGKGYGPIFKDGQPLLNFIRTHIQITISKHLMNLGNVSTLDDLSDIQAFVADQLSKRDKAYSNEEVDELVVQIENVVEALKNKDINRVHITFSMLRALRELNPYIFKDLTVTATCRENGLPYYFDSARTPDLDIAVACRASASLPVILNPVKINPKYLHPGYVHAQAVSFVDGGYLDNIPVGILEKKQGENNKKNEGEHGQNLQTLVLIFDGTGRKRHEQSPYHDEVTRSSAFGTANVVNRIFRDHIPRFVVGINTKERHTLTKEKGMHEVRTKYTQRNIPLHVTLDTIDFAQAKKDQHTYINSGYEQAREYLVNHDKELLYRTFGSLDELLEFMPEGHTDLHWDRIVTFASQCAGTQPSPLEV